MSVVMPGVASNGSPEGAWTGWSVPLLVSFDFGNRSADQARRAALRLGTEGAVGRQPSSGVIGWHAALTLGFELM